MANQLATPIVMEVVFYKCSAENIRVDKSRYLTGAYTVSGSLRDASQIIDPHITIEYPDFAYYLYNYCYIPLFQRYYFITEITSVRTNLWELSLHCDVLYTWRAELANELAIIDRSAQLSNANPYIDDGAFVMDSRKNIKVIPFPQPLNEEGNYILICGGGT